MNYRHTIAPLLVAVSIVGCGKRAENGLDGTWTGQTAGQTAGKAKPGSFRERWTFKEGYVTTDTGFGGTYTYKVDATKEPKHIDMTLRSPENADELRLGIYKIEEDMLTICTIITARADSNATRPEGFYPIERKDCMTLTFRRERNDRAK